MEQFDLNVNVEDIFNQRESEKKPKQQNTFNVKNYLQARLLDNETSKTMVIRLLPFSPIKGGSPFHKVHFHNVRVNKSVSPSGWKKFPCPIKNEEFNGEKKCPFCETAKQARIFRNNSISEIEKKKFSEVEMSNSAKEFWIVRCIERGHEEDGVKFWLFSNSKKGDGVYDKIINIFNNRYIKAHEQGKYNNIFDVNSGKDLILTLTKDTNGRTVINVTDDDEKTPLSTNYELAESWLKDNKEWNNVYTFKTYDYMSIVLQGGVPVYSKEKGTYVDKNELDKEISNEIDKNLSKPTEDLSLGINDLKENKINEQQNANNNSSQLDSVFVDDFDIPF